MAGNTVSTQNLKNLITKYGNRCDSEKFFFDLKWPDGFVCPNCGGKEFYFHERKGIYQCKTCRHQTSVRAGTMLEGSKSPLFDWIQIMYLYANNKSGISIKYISDITGIPYKRCQNICRKLKMAQINANENIIFEDIDVIELDVFAFGGEHEGSQGNGAIGKRFVAAAIGKKMCVFKDPETGQDIPAERNVGIKFTIVESENKAEIQSFLTKYFPTSSEDRVLVRCDNSRANQSLNIPGMIIAPQKAEKGISRIQSLDHCISNLENKARGAQHGVPLQFLELETADFEWKFLRREWTPEQRLESLGRAVLRKEHQTLKEMVKYFKNIRVQIDAKENDKKRRAAERKAVKEGRIAEQPSETVSTDPPVA